MRPFRLRAAAAWAAAAALLLAGCARPRTITTRTLPVAAPADAAALLAAMRERYDGRWYRTRTAVQRTTLSDAQGRERRETWYEAMRLPGRVRIDRDSARRTGTLFANDSQYVILGGTLRRAVPGHNAPQVLGFDVYGQPAARTAAVLRGLGFPPGPVRADVWQGRPVWVVGGAPGDLRSPQYWIDQERLVFVRLLQPLPGEATKTYAVHFGGYRPLGGGWLAARVEVFAGDQRTRLEEYEEVRAEVELPPGLFDARKWAEGQHWRLKR